MALWFYALPAMMLVASGSALTFPLYRSADSTAGRVYVYASCALLTGVAGLALTNALMRAFVR
jgi:hypothetical protein